VDDAALAERHGEMQWVSRIHNALEQNRLTLFYQLIVPVDKSRESSSQTTGDFLKYRLRKRLPWSSYHSHIDGNGSHFEVLLRMRDENGDFLPPGAFIPAAERYNQMPEIDRWVVKNTFDWLQRNKEYLEKMQLCTINLSGHTLSDKNFFSFVIDKLHSMDIPGEKICFEITETAAVANLTQAIKFMRLLKARGCRFALDDFGSGMSSFAYLKNLPVDYLKIDGNFVRNIVEDQIDYSMVEAINQVGHVMGIKTIAEFVENEQILEELKRVGVDYVQGFGLARPKPLEELIPNEPVTAGQIPVH
jgi:EAL domain-containing protein (putative c-di-GMP-specific phosphodiesterase class I)